MGISRWLFSTYFFFPPTWLEKGVGFPLGAPISSCSNTASIRYDWSSRRNSREFKMPTTNNGYGIRLKACFRIALTKADKIYISPEHTFHRSDLGYSVKITFLCCKTESRTWHRNWLRNVAGWRVFFMKKWWKLKDETHRTQSHAH